MHFVKKGRPRSMLCNSGSEIRKINRSSESQLLKRRSEFEVVNDEKSNKDTSFGDVNIIKSKSLQKDDNAVWISPFSRRKVKKPRGLFNTQSEQLNILDYDTERNKNTNKVNRTF